MWYLKSAFDAYQKVQDAVQTRLGDVQSAILSPMDMMKKFLVPSAPAQTRTDSKEVEELRKRVSELEARLERPARAKHAKRVRR